MDEETPLCGIYSSGQFVVVEGEQAGQELRLLGCFGQDSESAKRKCEDRRGPLDRLLLDKVDEIRGPTSKVTVLTLHEAYYLAYALGCLKLNTTDGLCLDLDSIWRKFREYQFQSNTRLDFAIEYGVYHYFRSRGWTVKSAENYGTSFLLYRDGPTIDHALYAVQILHEEARNPRTGCNWKTLLAAHRVIQSVCKELLLVFVTSNGSGPTIFDKPACIKEMSITVNSFTCKTNLML